MRIDACLKYFRLRVFQVKYQQKQVFVKILVPFCISVWTKKVERYQTLSQDNILHQ